MIECAILLAAYIKLHQSVDEVNSDTGAAFQPPFLQFSNGGSKGICDYFQGADIF